MKTSTPSFLGIATATLFINGLFFSNAEIAGLPENSVVWCTSSIEEHYKCTNFSSAVDRDKAAFGRNWLHVICKRSHNKEECMINIDQSDADIASFDAGDVFSAGRSYSLIPIMQEVYEGNELQYYSVAVIKKNTLTDVSNLHQLRSKKACFPYVGNLAGWVIPIETLMKEGGLEIIDCNNHVKSAINYFGPSCAVNSLSNKYNPIGDNSEKSCQLCIGHVPGGKCTPSDPYFGFEGAFRCLTEVGEIAFLRHSTVLEMTKNQNRAGATSPDDYELLCKDGSRRSVHDYVNCNWGRVPSDALMVSSAKLPYVRRLYQDFIQTAVLLYTNETRANSTPSFLLNSRNSIYQPRVQSESNFSLFESTPRYGMKHNLLVQESAVGFFSITDENQQTYSDFLKDALASIFYVRHCPISKMILCVTSDPELEKCFKMKIALKLQLLKPELICYKGRSHVHCMQAIKSGNADVTVLDAGDVYTAGLQYDEIPIVSEVYSLGIPEYYVVAVAKEQDPSTELTYLRGKYTCHPGIFTAAGWIVPLAYLISNGWIRSYGCDSAHAAAEYFGKSCVPGALSPEYATGNAYDNLCHLCHGPSYRYCRRDASEDYYGSTGALRCLIEGGGDVAFIRHTTVYENTDGKRKEWWARDALNDDFQLLCPDGTRSSLADYAKCNLGKVKANAVVTRGGDQYDENEVNAYINLFIYAQQFYSRRDDDEFSLFVSAAPYSDLIFLDQAQQLRVIEPEKRRYDKYLGNDFMRARRIVDCHASASIVYMSFAALTFTLVSHIIV